MADITTALPPDGPPSGPISPCPACLEIADPEGLNRVTTAFRLVVAIPIVTVVRILTGEGPASTHTGGGWATTATAGITGGLSVATLLFMLFRQRYPRWWFDFALELTRITTRVGAYLALLTDKYLSTVEHQTVALDLEHDLNLPLVKWFLAMPAPHPAVLPRDRRRRIRRLGLVRHPVHPPIPPHLVRSRPMGSTRPSLRFPSCHRPLPTVFSAIAPT
jgi:hypothetical protein